MRTFPTRAIPRFLLPLAAAAVLAGPRVAVADPCPKPAVVVDQPVDGGTLKVSRIAGAQAGAADQWDMRYDAWMCAPQGTGYNVNSVIIQHLSGGAVLRQINKVPTLGPILVIGGPPRLVQVRDDTVYPLPLPTSVRVIFILDSTEGKPLPSLVVEHPVAEHVGPGPLGGFFFPFRQSDLPAGAYWRQDRHLSIGHIC
jgi:hypothetical protein